ncbi:MAG: hypothetical protein AAB629_03020 [Patescibacteria group bacterium]
MKITLCGSMKFHPEMEKISKELINGGHKVKVPLLRIDVEENGKSRKMSIRAFIESNKGIDSFSHDHPIWNEKSNAIDDHFEKVEWSDAILVANYPKHDIDGYVGGNTLMEMGVAKFLRKKIFLLLPVSSKLSYKEEILGMKPVVINEDLSKIK